MLVELDVRGLDQQAAAGRHRVACVHGEVHEHLLDLGRGRPPLARDRA
jgi:hypothetical protein